MILLVVLNWSSKFRFHSAAGSTGSRCPCGKSQHRLPRSVTAACVGSSSCGKQRELWCAGVYGHCGLWISPWSFGLRRELGLAWIMVELQHWQNAWKAALQLGLEHYPGTFWLTQPRCMGISPFSRLTSSLKTWECLAMNAPLPTSCHYPIVGRMDLDKTSASPPQPQICPRRQHTRN